jgi:hypothetical protein
MDLFVGARTSLQLVWLMTTRQAALPVCCKLTAPEFLSPILLEIRRDLLKFATTVIIVSLERAWGGLAAGAMIAGREFGPRKRAHGGGVLSV